MKCLQLTSSLLLISFVFYLWHSKKNYCETALAFLLIPTWILAVLFWHDPVKNSLLHKMDARMAKITILFFILYTSQKPSPAFFVVVALALSAFCLSHHFSKEWGGRNHLLFHAFAHIFGFMTTLFAFV